MMQYTDTEAALIGGLISNYFFQPAVDASLKDAYGQIQPLDPSGFFAPQFGQNLLWMFFVPHCTQS